MECKRIPSAKVSCEALSEIMQHPCLVSHSESFSYLRGTYPAEKIEEIISAFKAREKHIPETAINKWAWQWCEPYTSGQFVSVGNWQAKTSYFYGIFYTYTPEGRKIKQFCLYHGKARIHSKLVARLWHNLTGGSGSPATVLKYRPWLILWDDPEYYRIWKDAKYQKKVSFKLSDGSIGYWDDQGQHQIIPPAKQADFAELDKFSKEVDRWYKACMDKPAERFWR